MTGRMRKAATVGLLAGLLVVAGCTDRGPRPAPGTLPPPASPPPSASVTVPAGPAAGPRVPDLSAPREIARGLAVPWGLAFLPGGDALVAERNSARILRVPGGGGQPRQVYRVPGVVPAGEGGLLGLAVSPSYATDRYVYAYFTAASDNRIVRFRLDDAASGTPEVVFDGISKSGVHNGGRIAFGPDGMLYAGTGDAAERGSAQDPNDPNGKILRLTPDGRPAPGNPTAGSPIYSLGHRNVQGIAWDSQQRMFAAEFGQNRFDELNVIEPGRNYGWPQVEGVGDTSGGKYTNPLVTWGTAEASPSGIAIAGDVIHVAALRGSRLWTVPIQARQVGTPKAELIDRYGRLRTVAVAPDGALWLTTSNTDGRGTVRPGDDRIVRFPPG
jgi:glucose/arabinose dehydrogenase